jgi:hypothetical protein
VQKVQINPRTTAKDLVKMLEETGTKVSISTVKRVQYWHNLKGRSARKKPLLQNCHKKARHKTDGIMREENYVDILKQHLKTSVRNLKLGCKWVFQAYLQSCGKMA